MGLGEVFLDLGGCEWLWRLSWEEDRVCWFAWIWIWICYSISLKNYLWNLTLIWNRIIMTLSVSGFTILFIVRGSQIEHVRRC